MLSLLKTLCEIHAPSGEEEAMNLFLLNYIEANAKKWAVMPEIISGEGFQDCIILKFGKPKTAIFAHMDSIGFTVRYQNQLVPIGGPEAENGFKLVGSDSLGSIRANLVVDEEDRTFYDFPRAIDRGTSLVFECDFRETQDYVQSCYIDNRLGVYAALKVAETLTDGIIVFSTYEEHGGGAVPFLAKYIYEKWQVKQALVADITWITDGVHHGEGVVISMRDKHIPRKKYINRILEIAQNAKIPYQIEVEGSGSSDGRELQMSPYPFDWCFVGAAEENVHSPNEIVHKKDIESMIQLYKQLMVNL
jgi:putative aminopeptidase FrvX